MRDSLQERANGRWFDILSAIGVDAKCLRNKHGPCPICGAGKDRFRWDNKQGNGTFYCSSCGSGHGLKFVMMVKGVDFKGACRLVEGVIGTAERRAAPVQWSEAEQKDAMSARWRAGNDLSDGDPVDLYLRRRLGGAMARPMAIRSAHDRPAMVALMQSPDGRGAMVHLTLLTESGNKAPVDKPKLMMRGSMAAGSAVRLAAFDDALGIAEGIETALSATLLDGVPCWAALNEGMLSKWQPPLEARRVVIYGDNDLNYVGQSSAYMLARRLAMMKDGPHVEVRIPATAGADWNDVLLARSNNS